MLPTLTVNRSFMRAFIGADTPCFALGMVEEHGRPCGLLALRPDEEIPAAVSDVGFNFGHSLFGSADFAVIHFAFAFYGYQTYNVLINPNNPLVQTVLNKMIADGDYFFFALEATGRVTAFRADIGQETLSHVKANLVVTTYRTNKRTFHAVTPAARPRRRPQHVGHPAAVAHSAAQRGLAPSGHADHDRCG